MTNAIGMTFWSYLGQMASARAVKVFLIIACLLVALVYLGFSSGFMPRAVLENLHRSVIVFGIPLFATLFSEMALRDGITHRTLLYPLLGPVSRKTIAVVRSLSTGLILFISTTVLVIIIRLICQVPWNTFPLELVAVLSGSLTYVALAGLIHLITGKGLISALAIIVIIDQPIGRLPFAIRNIAPSYHLRNISGLHEIWDLPISINFTHTPLIGSIIFCFVFSALVIFITAFLFSRKNLGGLC